MKCGSSSLCWFLIGCTLFSQVACRESVRSQQDSRPVLAAAEASAVATSSDTADSAPDQSAKTSSGPTIRFDTTVYDFGEISPGRNCVAEFPFANTGDSLLKISEVKKCCGAVTELDTEELAPGESGLLTVQYPAGRRAGEMRRQLYVSSNDPANPSVTLTISATIVQKVACHPQRLMLWPRGDEPSCPEITLASIDGQPFSIKTFTSTGNCLTADVDTSAQATQFVLRPAADLERLKSRSAGMISITLSHPECDRVDIPFSVMPRFGLNPSTLLVLDAKPQTPIVRDVRVISNYGEDFEVASVSSKHGSLKVLHQSKIREGYCLRVEITPPLPSEDKDHKTFADVLYVNIRGASQLAVSTYGTYAKDADGPASARAER